MCDKFVVCFLCWSTLVLSRFFFLISKWVPNCLFQSYVALLKETEGKSNEEPAEISESEVGHPRPPIPRQRRGAVSAGPITEDEATSYVKKVPYVYHEGLWEFSISNACSLLSRSFRRITKQWLLCTRQSRKTYCFHTWTKGNAGRCFPLFPTPWTHIAIKLYTTKGVFFFSQWHIWCHVFGQEQRWWNSYSARSVIAVDNKMPIFGKSGFRMKNSTQCFAVTSRCFRSIAEEFTRT